LLEAPEETLNQLASGGENGEADHDEENPLKDREKEAQDPQEDEKPACNQDTDRLDRFHGKDSSRAVDRRGNG